MASIASEVTRRGGRALAFASASARTRLCASGSRLFSSSSSTDEHVVLPADSNQVVGLAEYAKAFLEEGKAAPSESVLKRTNLFFTDAMLCGTSALALRTNAPTCLREEAKGYGLSAESGGVPLIGTSATAHPEKVIAANCASTREWDSNGTNFGYNPKLGHTAGEFGHPDFFPDAIASAQLAKQDGKYALLRRTTLSSGPAGALHFCSNVSRSSISR